MLRTGPEPTDIIGVCVAHSGPKAARVVFCGWFSLASAMFQSAEPNGMLSTLRFPFRWPLGARRSDANREQESERRFVALVDAHLDAIYRTARRLGARDGDIEDVVQEVLVVLARRLDDIETGKERAFALGTTARVVAGFRRQSRRRREELMAEVDAEGEHVHSLAPPLSMHGERHVEQLEALALLRTGLDAMTEPQRVTFVLFELEELRASEIAAELGVAEAAVVSRLERARKVMRRICERRRAVVVASRGESSEESLP
jgi:RNA polymerase sigma-70 factor (ECF subfamily)